MESRLLFLIFVVLFIPFVLGNCEEDQVDINTASLKDLDKIIGVGPVTAENIINSRPFNSIDDLIKVSGIGEIKLQDIKEQNLACVDESKDEEVKDIDEDEENDTKEIIEIKIPEKEVEKQEIKEININPKDINTESNNSRIIRSDYALLGFILFSVLILLLFMITRIKRNKNEFD